MYVAGLYMTEGVEAASFSIITTKASKHVAWIHDRMPLIVPADMREEWLKPNGKLNEVLASVVEQMEWKEDDDNDDLPTQMRMF